MKKFKLITILFFLSAISIKSFSFIFGLVHGMGFATALNEIGLPQNEFFTALIGFNFGVELAQVAIIFICYLFVAKWFSHKIWYQTKLVNPLSLGISCIALFWAVERYLSIISKF